MPIDPSIPGLAVARPVEPFNPLISLQQVAQLAALKQGAEWRAQEAAGAAEDRQYRRTEQEAKAAERVRAEAARTALITAMREHPGDHPKIAEAVTAAGYPAQGQAWLEMAAKTQKSLDDLRTSGETRRQREIDLIADLAASVNSPQQFTAGLGLLASGESPILTAQQALDLQAEADAIGPEGWRVIRDRYGSLTTQARKIRGEVAEAQGTPVKLSANESLVVPGATPDAQTVLARGVTPPVKPPEVGSFEDYLRRHAVEQKRPVESYTTQDIDALRERYRLDQRPSITVQTHGAEGTLPPRVETTVRGLASAFRNEAAVKRTTTMGEAVNFVGGLSSTTTNPADDQGLIYAFAKAMDPESVVREGEYATVQKYATSWLERFGFDARRVLSSETPILTPKARDNLKATIKSRYEASRGQYDNLVKSYTGQINAATGRTDGGERLTDYAGAFPGAPAAGSGGSGAINVRAPNGRTYSFPTPEAAAAFKKSAGIP